LFLMLLVMAAMVATRSASAADSAKPMNAQAITEPKTQLLPNTES